MSYFYSLTKAKERAKELAKKTGKAWAVYRDGDEYAVVSDLDEDDPWFNSSPEYVARPRR